MASPFRYFRKHTKAFMATAAVLAIFIFVVGGALSSGGNSGGNDRDVTAPVATWNGGSLNQGQLHSLIGQRLIVDDFLKRVFVQGGGQSGYDLPPSIPPLLLNSQRIEDVETDVIGTEVIASLATKAGMTVSDQMINHYIEEMGLKKVGGEQIETILKSLGQRNARQNEAIVFGMLRKMLLAHFYRRMYADQSMVVLPQERWNDWRKVNERISLQAADLPVEKFLAEVPESTAAQLEAFYNEHKDADPNRFVSIGGRELPFPEPGFAVPRRVRLQYLLGSVAERAEKLQESVTEEEIKDYYERNKRSEFTKMELPGEEATPPEPTSSSTPPAAEATPPAAEAAPPAETQPPTEPATIEPAPTEPSPGEGAAADGLSTESAPATEPTDSPAEPTPPPAEPAPAGDATEPKESSSNVRRSGPFRLVAFQDAPADAPPTESPPSETPATDAPPADAAPAETPEAEPPAEAAKADATSAAPPAAALPDAPAPKVEAEEPEYEPLEKVRDDIRKTLATDKAVQELERIMGEATAELQAEYNRYGSQVVEARELKKKAPQPPQRLADLTWLAEKLGLTYEKTAPLTVRELFETVVGKAADASTQRTSVTQAVYQTLDPYEPFLARELEGDWYVVLKTEDTPRRIPELKEVRDEVVQAWKRGEATKLAEKKAKELAAEAEKSPQPFDQFFEEKGYPVIKQTELFSWRNYPVGRAGTGQPPGLSDVPELKNIGPEFMDAAFGLDGNKTVGLLNFDKSHAYVIRLNRRQWTEDELRKLFLEEEGAWPGRIDMLNEHYSIFNNAVEKEILEERAGLKFEDEWIARRQERAEERQ